jgi:serine/threonine protein kinase
MNDDPIAQWQALSSLYEQACELDAGARDEFLRHLLASDPAAHQRLQRMLWARDRAEASGFLGELPAIPAAPDDDDAPTPPEARQGTHIGPYRLLRHLGAGGMAEVWLAARDDGAFRRQVAIKLPFVRAGHETLARRFERERDILASLRHPNIAGLIDAGVTPRGEAWLALEYVQGESITPWCDERRLSLRERVLLFRQVLLAVQHAHANLVIHRDLKPANILVTGQGEVRLLDFGIAKMLETDASALHATELTRMAGTPLTPRYASPEQLSGQPLTTACDVYALGVVFYELICGLWPQVLRIETVAAVEHAIVDGEPVAPSRRDLGAAAAYSRGGTVKALRRALAPELDAIALRCLVKAPTGRYSSVDALLADVDRWLQGEPVLARSPGAWTRAHKFALRHKLGVGLGSAAVLGLAATAAVAIVLGLQARDESARAVAVRDFTLSLFRLADQEKARGADITARDMLEAGRKDVATRLAGQLSLQAELLGGIAEIQTSMGEHPSAEGTYAELASVFTALRRPREAALALADQAMTRVRMGDPQRAYALLDQAVNTPGRPRDDAELESRLALVAGWIAIAGVGGDPKQALQDFERSRAHALVAYPPGSGKTLEALRGVIRAERELGNFARAIELQQSLEWQLSRQPGTTARERTQVELGGIDLLFAAGRFAQVTLQADQALQRCDAALGADDETCRRLLLKAVQAQWRVGDVAGAVRHRPRIEALADDRSAPFVSAEALVMALRLSDPGSPARERWTQRVLAFGESGSEVAIRPVFKAVALSALADTLLRAGDAAAALPLIERSLALQAQPGSAVTSALAQAKALKGVALLRGGEPEAALHWLLAAQRDFATAVGATHPMASMAALNVAAAMSAQGRKSQALDLVAQADAPLRAAFGPLSASYARIAGLRRQLERVDGPGTLDFFI